jgi:hypothetical protein
LQELEKMRTPEGAKSLRSEVEKGVKDVVKSAHADIELRKKQFLTRTTDLNIKRFELAEVEKPYNEAKQGRFFESPTAQRPDEARNREGARGAPRCDGVI